jgi:hypothetical protein
MAELSMTALTDAILVTGIALTALLFAFGVRRLLFSEEQLDQLRSFADIGRDDLIERLVLAGEPFPCGLFGYAKRFSYPGPADTAAAQDVDVVVNGSVGLGHYGLDLGQAGKQFVVWPLVPRAEFGRRFLGDDQVT